MRQTVKEYLEGWKGIDGLDGMIEFYSDYDGRKLGEFNLWDDTLSNENLLVKNVIREKEKWRDGESYIEVIVEV